MASEPANPLATGVTAELYKAAIGPRGQDYYLRHFLKFDADGRVSATWHWPACCATLNWLVFRKMWDWALAYGAVLLGLALVIFGVGKLLFNYSDSTGLLLLLLFLTAAFVLPGLYANAWYYTSCSKKISAALRNTAEVKDACHVLAGQASTKKRWFGLTAANVAVLALLASGMPFVLNSDQEGAHLAQTKKVTLADGFLTVAVPPAVDKTTEQAVVQVAAHAAVKAELSAVPVTPPQPEPLQVAAANTDKQTSAVTQNKPVAVATDARSKTRPVRADSDVKPKAVAAKRQWFVQVGAFAKETNAQNVRVKVEATGLQSTAEQSDTPNGRLIRVRAGPFESKADAEKAALQIKALDLPAVLVRQ